MAKNTKKRVRQDSTQNLEQTTRALLEGYRRELEVGHDNYWYGPERARMLEHRWGKFYR